MEPSIFFRGNLQVRKNLVQGVAGFSGFRGLRGSGGLGDKQACQTSGEIGHLCGKSRAARASELRVEPGHGGMMNVVDPCPGIDRNHWLLCSMFVRKG